MNSAVVDVETSKDKVARSLVATYYNAPPSSSGNTYQQTMPGRFVAQCVCVSGSAPSYALQGTPSAQAFGAGSWDQNMGNALRKAGAAGKVLGFSRGSVGYVESGRRKVLLNGWVVYHTHFIGDDSVVTAIFDDRSIFPFYLVFGRMVYEPDANGDSSSGGRHYFQTNSNDECIFNKIGQSDCLDSPWGPRFAPGHRYGHTASGDTDASDEPAPGYATTKTRKWRVSDILRYLRDLFFNIANRPPLMQDYGLMDLPQTYLSWPEGFGSNIKENRTPRDMNLQGMSLGLALQTVIRYAGPYDLYLRPLDDIKSEMVVIDFAPKENSGYVLYDAKSYVGNDVGEALSNPAVVRDGFVKEMFLGTPPGGVALIGDSPAVEVMASTTTGDDTTLAYGLKVGFKANEIALFKAVMARVGKNSVGFDEATKQFPSVFSWYKLNANVNPFQGGKWANFPNPGSLRMKTHQLTAYNANAVNPLGLVPREIVVEYKLADDEYNALGTTDQMKGRWRYAGRFSELQLSPCGRYLQIPGLRDQQKTYHTWSNGVHYGDFDYDFMFAREIRVQLAAESNLAMVVRYGNNSKDPSQTMHRINPAAPKFTLQIVNRSMQYIDWTRSPYSKPCGIGGFNDSTLYTRRFTEFQRKDSAGNELFTDNVGDGDVDNPKNRMLKHAQILCDNYKKVFYEGQFEIGMLTPVWEVGQQISYSVNDPIGRVSGLIKCVIYDNNNNCVKIEMGPQEASAIWDGPMRISTSGYSGSASGGDTPPPPPPTVETSTTGTVPTPVTPPSSDTGGSTRIVGPTYTPPVKTAETTDNSQPNIPKKKKEEAVKSANDADENNKAIQTKDQTDEDLELQQENGKFDDDAVPEFKPSKEMEDYGNKLKMQNTMDMLKGAEETPKSQPKQKEEYKQHSSIKTEEQMRQHDEAKQSFKGVNFEKPDTRSWADKQDQRFLESQDDTPDDKLSILRGQGDTRTSAERGYDRWKNKKGYRNE